MSNRRIYKPGAMITNIGDAANRIWEREYLIVNGKPTHPGWAGSWSVHLLAAFIRRGQVWTAALTEYGEQVMADRAANSTALDMEFEEVTP